VLNQHIGVTYVSPRIAALSFTPEEWIADPELWFRQLHPDDQKMILAEIEDVKNNGKVFKAEYRIRTRDGKMLWFFDEVVDILDINGNPLFRQGYMLDITARKQAEEDLRDQNAYLSLLNQMTRLIMLTNDFDATLRALAYDMKKIIDADDCYILRWDEENQIPIPITTTANLDFSFSEATIGKDEIGITESVLRVGHALTVEDVTNSPHIDYRIARRFPAQSILGVPLIAGGHQLGAVVIAFNSHHQFTQLEIDRAETAGNQIALALWEFQQSIEIQHSLKESNALANIGRALSETERIGTGKVLQLIVDSALELIEQAEESVIHLVDADEETLVPHAIAGFDAGMKTAETPRMRLGEGVAGLVIHSGETINVGNVHTSPLFLKQAVQPKFQSLLVAPVQSGDRQIGTISVQSDELNAFSSRDAELLNALGIQAAIAIENTNLFESTQQRLKEVNALYKTSQGLASSLDTDQLIKDVVNLLHQNFGYYHTQIYLLDPESGDLVIKGGSGDIGAQLVAQAFRVPRGMGITGHVAEIAKPFVTNDVNNVVFFVRNPLLPNTQAEMTVPIKVAGKVSTTCAPLAVEGP
jgi:PAS domain S-box-containing protein